MRTLLGKLFVICGFGSSNQTADLADRTFGFICRCARPDGGYAPSPDPTYAGNSDTASSDLVAVTYAATLAKTMNWKLPQPDRSIDFIHHHQQPDGSFIDLGGKMDPKAPASYQIGLFATPREATLSLTTPPLWPQLYSDSR